MAKLNLTYDEISPITNNLCVLSEADSENEVIDKMCMESGYITNNKLVVGSETVEKYEMSLPEVAIKHKIVDEEGSTWYPCTMGGQKGSLYAIGNEKEFKWAVAEVREIPKEIQSNYPVPGTEGEYYESFIDVENPKIFNKEDFEDAFEYYIILHKE